MHCQSTVSRRQTKTKKIKSQMKKASTKGGSGLPKASILTAPASKGAMKLAKPAAKKSAVKGIMKGAAKSVTKKLGK